MRDLIEDLEMEEWRDTRVKGERAFLRESVAKHLPISVGVAFFISLKDERIMVRIITVAAGAVIGAFLSFTVARATWEKEEQRYALWIQRKRERWS